MNAPSGNLFTKEISSKNGDGVTASHPDFSQTLNPFLESDSIKVLLIDDSEDDAMIAQAMLSNVHGAKFQVEWESAFDRGLTKLKENAHDVCLLDHSLGKKTGLDVLGEAKKFGCRIPIIMVTAAADRKIDLQAIKLGAADYVLKGETNSDLLERVIRHACERKKAETERELLTQQLMASSRKLGMAEVATDVLHTIGNALNSLNVSAGLLSRRFREMPIGDIKRLSTLLEKHQNDLGVFLTQDVKGQKIPAYLKRLGNLLVEQQDQTDLELDSLMIQINRVKHLIASQENLTKTDSMEEPVVLTELLEHALLITTSDWDQDSIEIIRDYEEIPLVVVDKHQVFQILVSIIRCAKDAMQKQKQQHHTLALHLKMSPDQNNVVHIEIRDTGIGIEPENLTRIFAQTFSPLNEMSGPNLHGSAIAAKNLGGTLSASSNGPGQGTTFSLELPIKFHEISEMKEGEIASDL